MSSLFPLLKKSISFLLKRMPGLKRLIIHFQYFLKYSLFRIIKKCTTKNSIVTFDIIENTDTFFGYYDKSPVNKDNSYILFHESERATFKKPTCKQPINIIVKSLIQEKKYFRYTTTAYNWQQGARTQWIDNMRFIFNDYNFKDDHYYSKIINSVSGEIERIVDYPIYDVFENKGFSLDFDRLAVMRPDYGYRNRIERGISIEINSLDNNGILKVDLLNNTQKLIISFAGLCDFEQKENMKGATHKVNHIMISPNGNKMIFLHRYFVKGRKFDRLIVYDDKANTLKLLADHDMVSHCFWYDSKQVIAFMRDFNIGDKYYIIDVETGIKQVLGNKVIDVFGDGHPNILEDIMLFDTYPNQRKMKELFTYNIRKSKLEKLGEFYTPIKYYGESRCDLHPRWSPDGSKIFFDSIHTGRRQLYMMNINKSEL